jgi:hypothetical protein
MRRRPLVIGLAPTLALCLAACGAKSGLDITEDDASIDAARAPDASRDAAIDAVPTPDAPPDATFDVGRDAPIDACIEQRFALTPIRPEIMFVVDRSTSMGWGLTGPGGAGPTRWSILVDALREQLPRYDERSDMGLTLFPAEGGDRCTVASDPRLAPAPLQASPILDVVVASGPGGRTPTASGLEAADRWFASHPDISHVRAVVLATDGAPNCNAALDPRRCPCTSGAGLPTGCGGESELCLDDARTLDVITRLASREVPTYVIGIDGEPDPALSDVLREMAIAGGRPNPLDPARGYYSVRRASDVSSAFDRIQASIVSCSLAIELADRPDRPVAVTLDGEVLPRDPSRTEGWEWSDERAQTILLYGEACTRAQDGEHVLDLTILC